ncbi:PadR family transcriptional regulator [Amycolatopsis sp. FBCC-B4732]|uniref:PadR family transcriptional regulator n=1 Tax=Amycolatopsis sp. FBCC-B4732 TaxID=3079339 RepID=UPI001FF20605|nr:PadR family transcriptional regulator [Amycolatopsis sp. FBCC-B4732]UOX90190.1 PadR family transcriptional regulator [Amycolatopsis sp. FBCC-B4732]
MLTDAELTVLGLVTERPRHGYELDEVVSERGMREWTALGFSSIYYVLGKLRDRGLVAEVEQDRAHAKAKKTYTATDAGRAACAAAAEAAIAELRPVHPPVLVGLANSPVVAPDRLAAALARRAEAVGERLAEVRRAAAARPDAPPFVRAIFDYSIAQLEAEAAWLEGMS